SSFSVVFVRLTLACVCILESAAATVYLPLFLSAALPVSVATPLLLVVAVAVNEPLKLALAPEPGAVNVTVTPPIGLLDASRTVAFGAAPISIPVTDQSGIPSSA